MNFHELDALVAAGESDRLELKQSTALIEAGARTVCGMLNGLGGFVLFGVSDNGRITGQDVSTRTREEIAEKLHRIEPLQEIRTHLPPATSRRTIQDNLQTLRQ